MYMYHYTGIYNIAPLHLHHSWIYSAKSPNFCTSHFDQVTGGRLAGITPLSCPSLGLGWFGFGTSIW